MKQREFLARLAAMTGLPALLGSVRSLEQSERAASKELEQVLVYLHTAEPEQIIDEFLDARMGRLTLYYQLFFPNFVGEGSDSERIERLEKLCDTRLRQPGLKRGHRLRALKGVAAAHSLATAVRAYEDQSMRGFLTEIITGEVRSALIREPHREVLEIVFQSLSAAIIRSDESWKNLNVEPDLIREVQNVCQTFLNDRDDQAEVLLWAAAAGWQFLLNYGAALDYRRDAKRLENVRRIQERIRRAGRESDRFRWLARIQELYSGQSQRHQMFPEYQEAVLGWKIENTRAIDQAFAGHAVLMRLQMMRFGERWRERPNRFLDEARKKDFPERGGIVLRNSGVVSQNWPELAALASRLELGQEAICGFKSWVERLDTIAEAPFEAEEWRLARELRRLLPFRKYDASIIAARVLDNPHVRAKQAQLVEEAAKDQAARIAFLVPGTIAGAKEAQAMPESELEELSPTWLKNEFREDRDKNLRNGFAFLKRQKIEPQHKPSIPPARHVLAGSVDLPPSETKGETNMNTPKSENSRLVTPTAAKLALFRQGCRRLRFPDETTSRIGFRILFRSGHPVEFLENGDYGITSERQLTMLQEKDVPYEIVS